MTCALWIRQSLVWTGATKMIAGTSFSGVVVSVIYVNRCLWMMKGAKFNHFIARDDPRHRHNVFFRSNTNNNNKKRENLLQFNNWWLTAIVITWLRENPVTVSVAIPIPTRFQSICLSRSTTVVVCQYHNVTKKHISYMVASSNKNSTGILFFSPLSFLIV